MRKIYAISLSTLAFIFFAVVFYQIGLWAPFIWTSSEEISAFTDIEKLSFRNTQSGIQLIGILVAGFISQRTYRKALEKDETELK